MERLQLGRVDGSPSRAVGSTLCRIGLAAVLTTTALLVPARALAHTYSPAHYNAPCSSGNEGYNYISYIYRPTSGTASYKGIQAGAYTGILYPCTSPGTKQGWSIVNAVSGQAYGSFTQFGYAEQSCTGGGCQNGFTGAEDFWYTAIDNNNGVIYAASWIDFDNNGSHDFPVTGSAYRYQMTYRTYTWRFCITRLSDGVYDCTDIARNGGYYTEAWYGFEVHNDASAMGNRNGDAYINITPMQYLNSNGSIYTTITGTTSCTWYPNNLHWVSEHCDASGGSGTTNINAWTASHT